VVGAEKSGRVHDEHENRLWLECGWPMTVQFTDRRGQGLIVRAFLEKPDQFGLHMHFRGGGEVRDCGLFDEAGI